MLNCLSGWYLRNILLSGETHRTFRNMLTGLSKRNVALWGRTCTLTLKTTDNSGHVTSTRRLETAFYMTNAMKELKASRNVTKLNCYLKPWKRIRRIVYSLCRVPSVFKNNVCIDEPFDLKLIHREIDAIKSLQVKTFLPVLTLPHVESGLGLKDNVCDAQVGCVLLLVQPSKAT